MKSSIRLYIIPLYTNLYSNDWYVFADKAKDNHKIDLVWLDNALMSLKSNYNIIQTEICGGEISLLSDFYFEMLINLIKMNCNKINLLTNFVKCNKVVMNNCDIINVKYNFNGFTKEKDEIFKNIEKAINQNKIINIKSLNISCQTNEQKIITELNRLKIKSWEIIPYHRGIGSRKNQISYPEHEKIIKKYIFLVKDMKFAFQNKLQLDEILNIDNYNVKNIYLTPNNKFAISNFNENNEFQLLEFDNLLNLQQKIEEMENLRDKICYKCDSKLRCLANRYLNLNYNGESCSGFKDLIHYYNN